MNNYTQSHSIIINAFVNAKNREKNQDIIYISFLREGVFYKDSYYILIGDKYQVEYAIEKAYKDVAVEKQNFPRADMIELLDTPLDTWCNSTCIRNGNNKCEKNKMMKCASMWTYKEHMSQEELDIYISKLKPGHYPLYTVEYM